MKLRPRGQNLVLAALTMLLITLMVMMTLGIGTKVKEKMELQTMADTAAYSNAVATARAFNLFGTLNRVGIAHVVSAISTQGLMNWTTYALAVIERVRENYDTLQNIWNVLRIAACNPLTCGAAGLCVYCPCAQTGVTELRLLRNIARVARTTRQATFRGLEPAAILQFNRFMFAANMVAAAQTLAWVNLTGKIRDQDMAKELVNISRPGLRWNELDAPDDYDYVGNGEINWNPLRSSVIPPLMPTAYDHHAMAVMGSRNHPFTTGRDIGIPDLYLNLMLQQPDVTLPTGRSVTLLNEGSSYINHRPREDHGSNPRKVSWGSLTALTTLFSSDDHGRVTSTYINAPVVGMCTVVPPLWSGAAESRLHSGMGLSFHEWTGGRDLFGVLHSTALTLIRGYPWFIDYNTIRLVMPGDNYGQPKNFAVIRRDYSARETGSMAADPWNPFFRFGFTAAGATLDTRVGSGPSTAQLALGTSITYYHRGSGNFREPPNFFNPFWRAGLTKLNIDTDGLDDFLQTFNGSRGPGDAAAKDGFEGLRANFFQGWQ